MYDELAYQQSIIIEIVILIISLKLFLVEQNYTDMFSQSYHAIGVKNIITANWTIHSKGSYLHAARSSNKIGTIIGDFIIDLVKNETSLLQNVHLVGHSLGAHIFGFAGKHIHKITGGKIGRITGNVTNQWFFFKENIAHFFSKLLLIFFLALDAAAPLFEVPLRMPDNRRLVKTDATFVDAIHTNVGFFGFLSPFADADFYVNNGGPLQPGCININIFDARKYFS